MRKSLKKTTSAKNLTAKNQSLSSGMHRLNTSTDYKFHAEARSLKSESPNNALRLVAYG